MPNFLELLFSLKGSYSGVFVLFWGAMLIACFGVRVRETSNEQRTIKLERVFFWIFGSTMLAFAAFRPIGIARDDMPYLEIFKTVCPTLACGQWVQGARDWGWYTLLGLLKSLLAEPNTMLWLGGIALLIKLSVIYSLARRPLLILLLYSALYYEVQDLTALRVSLAIAAFMGAIWLICRLHTYWNAWALFVCGLFHKQALIAPLILVGVFLRNRHWLLVTICVTPIALMLLGIYPGLDRIFSGFGVDAQSIVINGGLDAYIAAKNEGVYQGFRVAPVVAYPQILLFLWLLINGNLANSWLESLIAGSLVMGCLFLWGFASLPDAQVRFFEFLMVPTILLAGFRRLHVFEFIGVIAVSAVFVLKYNVLHHLLA